jgi:hypothetical protein
MLHLQDPALELVRIAQEWSCNWYSSAEIKPYKDFFLTVSVKFSNLSTAKSYDHI